MIVYPFVQTTRTASGITFDDNKNGSITVNGTATGNISFFCSLIGAEKGEMILAPGTYTLSDSIGAETSNVAVIMHYSYDNWATTKPQVALNSSSPVQVTLTKTARARIQIGVQSGAVVESVKIRPQLERGSTATSFVKGDATGQVWIQTGTESPAAFNALKKNAIQLCPIMAYQYISGAWVSKAAQSYIGGAWVDWAMYLINDGADNTALTGGWQAATWGFTSSIVNPTITFNGDAMVAQITVTETSGNEIAKGGISTANAIDLTDVSSIEINLSANAYGGGYPSDGGNAVVEFVCGETSSAAVNVYTTVVTKGSVTDQTFAIDTSSLAGDYYIGVRFQAYVTNGMTLSASVFNLELKR